jgi:hypothetical protein
MTTLTIHRGANANQVFRFGVKASGDTTNITFTNTDKVKAVLTPIFQPRGTTTKLATLGMNTVVYAGSGELVTKEKAASSSSIVISTTTGTDINKGVVSLVINEGTASALTPNLGEEEDYRQVLPSYSLVLHLDTANNGYIAVVVDKVYVV